MNMQSSVHDLSEARCHSREGEMKKKLDGPLMCASPPVEVIPLALQTHCD